MKNILLIFALSICSCSQEDTNPRPCICDVMILSDALPVQFWLNECETYNEHEPEGVHYVCWCQPWNCDDEITLQFQGTTGLNYRLIILDSADVQIANEGFTETSSGVYSISIALANYPDACDKKIKLQIAIAPAPLSQFTNNTDPFYPGQSWTEGETPSVVLAAAQQSKILWAPISGIEDGVSYTINYEVSMAAFVNSDITVKFLKDGDEVVSDGTVSAFTGTSNSGSLTIVGAPNANYIGFYITDQRPGIAPGSTFFEFDDYEIVGFNPLQAKSDCLDIKTAHDETILITYSNNRNFDGLIYENQSPDISFNIRVPSRFYHEREPEEDNAMELTSSVITTSSEVKTQRLLEVQHVPYYFHKKLRRILKHQNLTIYDKAWKKEEAYEVIEGKKTWPLKSATCYLTEKNSVVRNVL